MAYTIQVLYPADGGTTFDFDHYLSTHIALVGEHLGPFLRAVSVSRGLSGGPDTPPGFHLIATFTFADQAGLDAALAAIGPVMADIPNFYGAPPQILIGAVAV